MNVYIFTPARKWSYCGGTIIIAASSFEEAKSVLGDGSEELFMSPEEADSYIRPYHVWVLNEVLNCPDLTEARVIVNDYNWG